jgi:hypothetical protein
MFCTECGVEVSPDSRFCNSCGAKQSIFSEDRGKFSKTTETTKTAANNIISSRYYKYFHLTRMTVGRKFTEIYKLKSLWGIPLYFGLAILTTILFIIGSSKSSTPKVAVVVETSPVPAISNWRSGITYASYGDGSCTPESDVQCLDENEYKDICIASTGVTNQSIILRAVNAIRVEKVLLEGGSTENISVKWGTTRSGRERCFVLLTKSGIVDGNSARLEIQGQAKNFILGDNGKVLVSYWMNF